MKVVYIGNCDSLAASVMERMKKEEWDVYFLSEEAVTNKNKLFSRYKNYQLSKKKEEFECIFTSINPDVVIYAGMGYTNEEWDLEQKENLSLLPAVLEECIRTKVNMFVCLSSTEVYGNGVEKTPETAQLQPCTKKGMWMLQEEYMTEMYHKQYDLNTVILRLEPVFGGDVQIGSKEFLGQMADKVLSKAEISMVEQILQPVHVSDVADAIKRVVDMGKSAVYNVASSEQCKKSDILKLICKLEGKEPEIKVKESSNKKLSVDNSKIKKEQEWIDFWQLDKMLQEKNIVFQKPQEKIERKKIKKGGMKSGIRRTIENLVVFLVFGFIYFLTQNHTLFSQVDWLLIYIVVISLGYGVKQAALAVGLSSIIYLVAKKSNILEMTNFYSYVQNVLMIVEFIFFGIVVGYTGDMLREEKRNQKQEMELLSEAHEKLKEINSKNILIKNEYEKRVLDAKTSFSRLYAILNKIDVLNTERIFMEVLHVVEELMQTNTVAVYKVNANSSYLRLIDSLNEKSVMEGNSWDLKEYPAIHDAIHKGRIYEGDIWKKEPAIVLPIVSSKGTEAVIVIKELSMEKLSLYHINLLRTLLELLSDSMEKALQYDSAMREQKYLKDTNILRPEEFQKAVELAEEKKEREMADYCILKLNTKTKVLDIYQKVENMFREMDIWGTDRKQELYILLGNTSEQDGNVVIERLEKIGITAEAIEGFSIGG
ncbi:MAG: NAD(P)-dependent oxidoreductase [Lachnospiraceae bacterium]|nr:NAD(P)-dependent oxidoreductase [Lachnospiraceae bacterium]